MPPKKRQIEEEATAQPCKKPRAGQVANNTLLNIQVSVDGTAVVDFDSKFDVFPQSMMSTICKQIDERYVSKVTKTLDTTLQVFMA